MYNIGVDIGGTSVKAGIVDLDKGKIIKKDRIETKSTRGWRAVVDDIIALIKRLSEGYEYGAIGIGCPGAVDSKTGIIQYANNLYWKEVPLGETISKALGKPVKVTNDANAAALGEAKFGAGKAYSDVTMLTLGTGVGGGIVVDGKMFEGYGSMGGEVGHMVIKEGGPLCSCGRNGCLESYASATALTRETISAMMIDKYSLMWELVGGDLNKVDGSVSFEAAKKGDATAKKVVDRFIKMLSEGILNMVNIFRSRAVIIGGGVSVQGEYLLAPIREYVSLHRYGGEKSIPVDILAATLGNDAGILGAAAIML